MMLEDVFMKVSMIEVHDDGTCYIPAKDFCLDPYVVVSFLFFR